MPLNIWISGATPKNSWGALTLTERKRVLDCGVVGAHVHIGAAGAADQLGDFKLAGLRTRIHEWEGHKSTKGDWSDANRAHGLEAGYKRAEQVILHGAEGYDTNAENDTWRADPMADGDPDKDANPLAHDFLRGVAEGFKGRAVTATSAGRLQHKVDIGYLGLGDPTEHYDPNDDANRDGVADASIPKDFPRVFSMPWFMLYQSNLAILKKKLERESAAWGNPARLGVFCSSGRVDVAGAVIGSEDAWLELAGDPKYGITDLAVYFANPQRGEKFASWRMFTEGHARHRPWVQLIPAILQRRARLEALLPQSPVKAPVEHTVTSFESEPAKKPATRRRK